MNPAATDRPLLVVDGVRKTYDGRRLVLQDVNLDVAHGEIVGLLGHNGAGKTTLVSIVAGLRPLTSGSVSIAGVDVSRDSREARRHIGLAPQELGIYPILTSRENLVFFGELNGLFGKRLKQRVNEVAESLELTSILHQRAFELSGGQKRRLHTACALLHRPPLVMLDEPTVGADVGTRLALLHAVRRLADEGSGVIYSTHYLPEIEELRASVAILQGGRIIARGTLSDLVAEHGTSVIELTFEGQPPPIAIDLPTEVHDSTVRIVTDTPAAAAARALAALGEEDERRLRGVQILRPSLESVYLSLTGERYSSSGSAPAAASATPSRRG